MAGAFASAVYGQKAVAMEVVDENEEEEGGVLEQKTVEKPEQKPLKAIKCHRNELLKPISSYFCWILMDSKTDFGL